MECLRQRLGFDENDTSWYDRLNQYSMNTAFDEVMMWEGLIGYGYIIRRWVKDIYGVDLDEISYSEKKGVTAYENNQ
jgi:hypothetical protein